MNVSWWQTHYQSTSAKPAFTAQEHFNPCEPVTQLLCLRGDILMTVCLGTLVLALILKPSLEARRYVNRLFLGFLSLWRLNVVFALCSG